MLDYRSVDFMAPALLVFSLTMTDINTIWNPKNLDPIPRKDSEQTPETKKSHK